MPPPAALPPLHNQPFTLHPPSPSDCGQSKHSVPAAGHNSVPQNAAAHDADPASQTKQSFEDTL